jgi:DNA-nicking Smr family endonuclease
MSDVTPLPKDRRGRVAKQPPTSRRDHRLADEIAALSDLRDLVEGRGTFMIQYTDEYTEGVAPGVDRRLAQRLHQGEFAIQAHLDLHGYTVDEARLSVDRFLTNAYANGQRCVRLVHGRGRNSINNQPVLKEQVRLWLSHGRLSRLVLAFATAPLTDGGAGAVYALLRRATPASRRK